MGIMGYYIRDNKKGIFENRISALKKLIKQYGEGYPDYPIWKKELAIAEEKLRKLRGKNA